MIPKKVKLSYRVAVFDDGQATLTLQVTHTDSRVINRTSSFMASNGFRICTSNVPEMRSGYLYLWGNDPSSRNNLLTKNFRSLTALQEYVGKIQFALKEWSNSYELFVVSGDAPVVPADVSEGSYEFSA